MDSREELPRVSVGNVTDWQRVKEIYKLAVLATLEENTSPLGLFTERDSLIDATNQFINQTLQMAQLNLRVNGQNYEALDQDEQNMEPFDEALDRRIWSLADTRLQWQKRIAETRRVVPHEIATAVHDIFDQQLDIEREAITAGEELADIQATISAKTDVFPRYFDMEEQLQKTAALGKELDQTITSQEERAGRIKTVTEEVKALKV